MAVLDCKLGLANPAQSRRHKLDSRPTATAAATAAAFGDLVQFDQLSRPAYEVRVSRRHVPQAFPQNV
jgi:hypothetical protein